MKPVYRIGLFALCGTALLIQQTLHAVAAPSTALALDQYFQRRVTQSGFSGETLVARGHDILFEKAFGKADVEHGVALTSEMPMRIGSLTKPITAVAVMHAVEEKKLQLDAPICKFLSKCPRAWQAVTIDHLLSHTSGLPDLFQKLPAVPVEQTTGEVDKVLDTPAAKPIAAAGSKYSYNNFGYILLGYALEKVYAKPYPEIMQALVFVPAGMKHATYDYPDRIIPNRVRGYISRNGTLYNTKDDPAAYSAGGLLLSSSDLFHFERALFDGKLLASETRDLLFQPPAGQNYGRGWQVAKIFGRQVYQHNGETHGASASFVYVPSEHLWMHVLSNIEDTKTRAYVCDALSKVYGGNYLDPTLARHGSEPEAQYTGRYEFPDGTIRDIVLQGGVLNYSVDGHNQPLEQLAPAHYVFAVDESIRLDFKQTPKGFEMTRSRCNGDFETAYSVQQH